MESIVHVTSSLDFGGIETHVVLLAREYRNKGQQCFFIAISSGGRASDSILALGQPVMMLHSKHPRFDLRSIFQLRNILNTKRDSVIVLHGSEAIMNGGIAALLGGRREDTYAEWVGTTDMSLFSKFIFKSIFRVVTQKVLAVSQQVRDNLIAKKFVRPERIVVAYPAAYRKPSQPRENIVKDINLRKPLNGLHFVVLSRLVETKRVEIIVNAFRELLSNSTRLRLTLDIFGSGKCERSLREFINQNNLEESIRIQGYLPNANSNLPAADFYLQVSESEGYGISLIEAMNSGMIPISTNVGIARELLISGENGFLLKDEDPSEELINLLKDILNMKFEDIEKLKKSVLQTDLSRYSATSYLAILSSLR
jgi:glycosyltransferase involved in cell wall biosynthesis